jgi:ubiquinone/menaquinone biosynthesis C-methylase UbiE
MPSRLLVFVLLLNSLGSITFAQDELAKIPPALETYMGRRISYTMGVAGAPWLIRKNRQQEEDCETLLKELQLKLGMTVCDMGCGNGFYALKMAPQVGQQGQVLAVDIQRGMLRLLQARAEENEIENVKPILSTIVDPKLPKNEVDLILCVDVYHEFSHPEHMLKAMRDSLSKNGVIALAEYREEDPEVPIKPLHKMSKKQILKEYSANGLKLVREFDGLPWQHLMFFARDENWKPSKSNTSESIRGQSGLAVP